MVRAEKALSAGVLAIGIGAAAVTATLVSDGGYSGIGPHFIPGLVAAGLIVLGGWLLYEALAGGWRNRTEEATPFHLPGFVWLSLGLLCHMVLIGTAGFVIAGAVLFVCVARGFGGRRPALDALIGLALTLALYVFFVKLLNVSLPAGWMSFLP